MLQLPAAPVFTWWLLLQLSVFSGWWRKHVEDTYVHFRHLPGPLTKVLIQYSTEANSVHMLPEWGSSLLDVRAVGGMAIGPVLNQETTVATLALQILESCSDDTMWPQAIYPW